MRDILIPKDLESSTEQNKISFDSIIIESSDKKSHNCCIVSPKSVSFDEHVEETVVSSSNIDFPTEEEIPQKDIVVFTSVSVECDCKHEIPQQPTISDVIDFGNIVIQDETDPEVIIPEDVIFNSSSGYELEHIVHHIKTEHRDYYKGTSFRWVGTWIPDKLYSGDEYFVDFVKYNNALWVCIKSHFGTESPSDTSEYWEKVFEGGTVQDDSEYSTWLEYE